MIVFQTKAMSFCDKNGQVGKNIATVHMDAFITKGLNETIIIGPYLKIVWKSPIISSKQTLQILTKKLEHFINTTLFLINVNGKNVYLLWFIFPTGLKNNDISSIFKHIDQTDQLGYRIISILANKRFTYYLL